MNRMNSGASVLYNVGTSDFFKILSQCEQPAGINSARQSFTFGLRYLEIASLAFIDHYNEWHFNLAMTPHF